MRVLNRRRVASTPKNIRLLLIVVCVVYLTYLISYLVTDDKPNPGRERSFYSYRSNLLKNASNKNDSKDLATRQSEKSHSKKNYFQFSSRLSNLGLIINTPKCQIPDFDVFDEDVRPFVDKAKPIEDCKKTHYNWSYIKNKKLMINTTQVSLDGYWYGRGFCCYKYIQRVRLTEEEEKDEKKLANADNLIKYSSCISISSPETEISHEFIVVECGWLKFIPVAAAYRGFHAIAIHEKESIGRERYYNIKRKLDYWKSRDKDENRPPNILILGLDSTARLNFRRNMFKTLKMLEKIEAVEIFGYTKVGENTFPNLVPFTTGYSEEDLKKICFQTPWNKQDDCPYIWKRFDMANYITAHSEDSPVLAIYNYFKTGFVKQPVDFYLRPMFLSAHDFGYPPLYVVRREYMDCIGQKTNDEMILSYVESVLELGHANKTPVYSLSWSTDLSHGGINYIQLSDDTYAQFIENIERKGFLENTIFVFMGDHGYRFGPFRETLLGFYEDKTPLMWIRLPSWIREIFPEWQAALEMNARRLTNPYTVYNTLNYILEMFSEMDSPKDSIDTKTGLEIKRKYRQNFLEDIPIENSCSDIGIPNDFCPCTIPKSLSLNDPILIQASDQVVKKINEDLKIAPQCSILKVTQITTGTVIQKDSGIVENIVVGFITTGEFEIEGVVQYFVTNKTFDDTQVKVLRTNKINHNDIKCIKDAKLELYCYCS